MEYHCETCGDHLIPAELVVQGKRRRTPASSAGTRLRDQWEMEEGRFYHPVHAPDHPDWRVLTPPGPMALYAFRPDAE